MADPVFRVVGSRSGDWQALLENPKALRGLIGPDVLAAFYKCFVGLDRITSIEHLILLTHQHSTQLTAGRHAHSVERDYQMLMLMMVGTMYELAIALQNLLASKVVANLHDRSTWAPLDEIRKRWQNDPMANTMRNGFAHHLGDVSAYALGIDKSADIVVFQRGSGGGLGKDRFIAPWDALLAGEGIRDEELEPFLQRMSSDHRGLRKMLFDFFGTVAQSRGVAYVDETID